MGVGAKQGVLRPGANVLNLDNCVALGAIVQGELSAKIQQERRMKVNGDQATI